MLSLRLHPTNAWQADANGALVHGRVRVAPGPAAPSWSPPGLVVDSRPLATAAGWNLSLDEYRDAGVWTYVASLLLAGETTRVIATTRAELSPDDRDALVALLETAEPYWSDAVVLRDLLGLPPIG